MYRQLSSDMQEEYVSLLTVFENLEALYLCRNVITVYPDCKSMIDVARQNVITGSETVTENLKVVLQIQDIGMLFLLGGAVILVALCCSILPILRANPKDILAKMEG